MAIMRHLTKKRAKRATRIKAPHRLSADGNYWCLLAIRLKRGNALLRFCVGFEPWRAFEGEAHDAFIAGALRNCGLSVDDVDERPQEPVLVVYEHESEAKDHYDAVMRRHLN